MCADEHTHTVTETIMSLALRTESKAHIYSVFSYTAKHFTDIPIDADALLSDHIGNAGFTKVYAGM